LADGVSLVWVIDPQRAKVVIHRLDGDQQTTLQVNNTLSGGNLLPDFVVFVGNLFGD
jgi:Uma2 family endonuclease